MEYQWIRDWKQNACYIVCSHDLHESSITKCSRTCFEGPLNLQWKRPYITGGPTWGETNVKAKYFQKEMALKSGLTSQLTTQKSDFKWQVLLCLKMSCHPKQISFLYHLLLHWLHLGLILGYLSYLLDIFACCRYHLKDVIVGKIYFLLVRIKIKHMELQIIKRETTGAGTVITDEIVRKFDWI